RPRAKTASLLDAWCALPRLVATVRGRPMMAQNGLGATRSHRAASRREIRVREDFRGITLAKPRHRAGANEVGETRDRCAWRTMESPEFPVSDERHLVRWLPSVLLDLPPAEPVTAVRTPHRVMLQAIPSSRETLAALLHPTVFELTLELEAEQAPLRHVPVHD